MAFERPITVKEAVENVHSKRYLLPAIQREVVWVEEQITKLFDSLMRDYPIGSFLFWHVRKENANDYQFYEFIRDYHEKKKCHNEKASLSGEEDVIGILDGQQRLTSLYIGLMGSYAYKEPRKRWDNPEAFPTRRLYLNLLPRTHDGEHDTLYEFAFLTDQEANNEHDTKYWYRVSSILRLQKQAEVQAALIEYGLSARRKEEALFASNTLFKLWEVAHQAPVINYYLEKDTSLDKVLNIFVRVNAGGTPLSYSDPLLSIASAQWKKRDAREEITSFVDQLNAIGSAGFNFDKDLVLKSCLVLADFGEIAFKVDNFNKKNMLAIETQWDQITTALRDAVMLLSSFGYSRDTLTANSAVIPIAYYLLKRGLPRSFAQARKNADERAAIRQWLTLALMKRVFGGVPDNVLRPMRDVIRDSSGGFPLASIKERFKGTNKSLQFTEDDIESLLMARYGQGYTFSVLSILYPTLDYRNSFHIDHIYARALMTTSKLKSAGLTRAHLGFCVDSVDLLPNLQLLEGIPNQEKNDSLFEDWLEVSFKSKRERSEFRERQFIPRVALSLPNFPQFFIARQELLKERLMAILDVPESPKSTTSTVDPAC